MKVKFPKLQSFLIKPIKEKNVNSEALSVTSAFVHKGKIIAVNATLIVFIDMKQYLKEHLSFDAEEDVESIYQEINKLCETLEGKTLSKEFFTIFSKYQNITYVSDTVITVLENDFRKDFFIEEPFDVLKLEEQIEKYKSIFSHERSEQGDMCIGGKAFNTLKDIFGTEISDSAINFKRTVDEYFIFTIFGKEYIFGLGLFDSASDSSIIKFTEGDDFFDEI